MTAPRNGEQLASTVCATRVVVVRAPAGASGVLACGGSPMVPAASAPPAPPTPAGEAVTLLGKRYTDAAETLELLCTSAGTGELTYDGAPLSLKAAKPLPASD
ncbi:hypothetical protein GCM10022221_23410 [Actinocorallia aurea]